MSAADALAMLEAGASLLQVYTGLIYHGPLFAQHLNRGLLAELRRRGLTSVMELHSQ